MIETFPLLTPPWSIPILRVNGIARLRKTKNGKALVLSCVCVGEIKLGFSYGGKRTQHQGNLLFCDRHIIYLCVPTWSWKKEVIEIAGSYTYVVEWLLFFQNFTVFPLLNFNRRSQKTSEIDRNLVIPNTTML